MIDPEMSAEKWLEENPPATDAEATAAVRGILDQRERDEAARQCEALTEFEQALMEAAYYRGQQDADRRVSRAVGSAAVTVDAAALRSVLASHDQELDFRRWPTGEVADQRVADLVAATRRRLEHERELKSEKS